jgi:hypothetical protein
LGIVGKKEPDELFGEILDASGRGFAGEEVDGVLHRVGGEDFVVVAVGEAGEEIALKKDFDGPLLKIVDYRLAIYADEAYARLAVAIFGESGHKASISSIRCVPMRAEKQGDVETIFVGAYFEGDFDDGIESGDVTRSEVGGGLEGEAIGTCDEGIVSWKNFFAATFGVGFRRADHLPFGTLAVFEPDEDARRSTISLGGCG